MPTIESMNIEQRDKPVSDHDQPTVETDREEGGESNNVPKRIQPWRKQITLRGIITSTIVGSIYSVIAMKLNLTTGIVPHFNVSAALLAFIFIESWTKILAKAGIASVPFTPQENTMILTSAVACFSIATSGGLGSYLLGLDKITYEHAGVDTPGNNPTSYKKLSIGWMTGYQFLVCFIGLFVLIPLKKVTNVDSKTSIFPFDIFYFGMKEMLNIYYLQFNVIGKLIT